ncbi:unnamed protein product [Chrysoparadoxa australica]
MKQSARSYLKTRSGMELMPQHSRRAFPIYEDLPDVEVPLPKEILRGDGNRIHVLTRSVDCRLQPRNKPKLFSFVPSKDCYVYLGMDSRIIGGEGTVPEWVETAGFRLCQHLPPVSPITPHDGIETFSFWKRFFSCGTRVLLGTSMSKHWHTGISRGDQVPAMYFVVVRGCDEENSNNEVDIGDIRLDRKLGEKLLCSTPWKLVPHFQPGEDIYADRHYTIENLPPSLCGAGSSSHAMLLQTAQSDKHSHAVGLCRFTVFKPSQLFLCYDSRAHDPPEWIHQYGFEKLEGETVLGSDGGKSGPYHYDVYSKKVASGDVVLDGNRQRGASRMYFLLACSMSKKATAELIGEPVFSRTSAVRQAVVPSCDFVSPFWDEVEHGPIIQLPLQLDWRGRGWSRTVGVKAIGNTGELSTPAGTFGISIDMVAGVFHKAKVMTVWPRFLLCNRLQAPVCIIPCLEGRSRTRAGAGAGGVFGSATGVSISQLFNIGLADSVRPDDCPRREVEFSYLQDIPAQSTAAIYDFVAIEPPKGSNDDGVEKTTRCVRLCASKLDPINTEENPEVTHALPIEDIGASSYVRVKRGAFRDLLVKAACSLMPNGVTIMMTLTDASDAPPMRIENRSSTHTILYRHEQGGELRTLEPMRWHAFLWKDDTRVVEVGFGTEGTGTPPCIEPRRRGGSSGKELWKAVTSPIRKSRKRSSQTFTSYEPVEFGRLTDLVNGEKRLTVECVRRSDSARTMTMVFRDTDIPGKPVRMRGRKAYSPSLSGAMTTMTKMKTEGVTGKFELWLSGLIITLADSTQRGPIELCCVTLDDLLIRSDNSFSKVQCTIWHLQVDDLTTGSAHPVMLQPVRAGLNSHMNDSLVPTPFLTLAFDRNSALSSSLGIYCFNQLAVAVADLSCSIYVDYWVDIADLVYRSVYMVPSSAEAQASQDVANMQQALQRTLILPPEEAGTIGIFLSHFEQAPFSCSVDFHLGRKLLAMVGDGVLKADEGADEADDEDENGPVSQNVTGSMGWGMLLSIGDVVANASPVFLFKKTETRGYFGSTSDFAYLLLRRFTSQTVGQVYRVLGHLDIVGDPLTLASRYSSGISNLVTKSAKGHAKEGAIDLLKAVVGGTASSAGKITTAIENLVVGWDDTDPDTDKLLRRLHLKAEAGAERQTERPILESARHLARGIVSGVAGVAYEPYRGAEKDGAKGFTKGTVTGLVGLVAQPIGGALGAVTHLTRGIEAATELLVSGSMGRRRDPRAAGDSVNIKPLTSKDLHHNLVPRYIALMDDWRHLGLVDTPSLENDWHVEAGIVDTKLMHAAPAGGGNGYDLDRVQGGRHAPGMQELELKQEQAKEATQGRTFDRMRHAAKRSAHKLKVWHKHDNDERGASEDM